MRSLRINQQPVFFKLYEGQEEILTPDGLSTGSYLPKYSELKSAMLCVSPNKGSSEVNQFGTFADYDRTMTTSDPNCLIDEDSILWVDGADTDGPYNAIVKLKAPWKNSVQYAIQHVSVSTYEKEQEQIKQIEALKKQMEEASKVYAQNQGGDEPQITAEDD